MEGRVVMKTLQEKDPGVRVILFSGLSEDPVMKNYREMGFKGMVHKPFRMEDLRETIWKAIHTEP